MNENASKPEEGQEKSPETVPAVIDGKKCKYCDDPDPKRVSHLVVVETEDEDGESHCHVHAPFENKLAMSRMLNAIEEEIAKHKRGDDPKKKAEDLI